MLRRLLAAPDEPGLHRVVVRVAAAGAWVGVASLLLVGWLTGEGRAFVAAGAGLIAGMITTAQIAFGKEDGSSAMLASGLVVGAWFTIFPGAVSIVAVSVCLVLVSAVSMLFVTKNRTFTALLIASGLFLIPQLWPLDVVDQVVLGIVMMAVFFIAASMLVAIQTTTTSLRQGYRVLFDESPAAVLEEDWTEALEYLGCEYSGKPERIHHFLEAYPAVVSEAVARVRVRRVNEAALRLLGIDRPERLLGARRPDTLDEGVVQAYAEAMSAFYRGASEWESEIETSIRTGESRWLEVRAVDASTGPVHSTVVVGLADMTHIKRRSLAMADLVKAKDEFIASVSHELRTPLTAVIGLTSEMVAIDDTLTSEDRAELLELVSSQANEMYNIVEDLLVAARSEVGNVVVELQPVDLMTEMRNALEGVGASARMPATSPPLVMGDARRVRQILRNLVTNALRYGGPDLVVSAGSLNAWAWVEVRDNGDGVPPDSVDKIFQPYMTGKTKVAGSVGLGLAVARRLAEAMGGTLEYERVGGESVFRLELPVISEREPALADTSRSH